MKVYRITQARHATSPEQMLDGMGAYQYGGRWNSPGVSAIYCAETLSLAALEILVHIPRGAVMHRYQYIEVDLPDDFPTRVQGPEPGADTQFLGDSYLSSLSAFMVPSVVNPKEHTVILNPASETLWQVISFSDIQDFPIDPRLRS